MFLLNPWVSAIFFRSGSRVFYLTNCKNSFSSMILVPNFLALSCLLPPPSLPIFPTRSVVGKSRILDFVNKFQIFPINLAIAARLFQRLTWSSFNLACRNVEKISECTNCQGRRDFVEVTLPALCSFRRSVTFSVEPM